MKHYSGWYARRRGILEHLESGLINPLDSFIHDFLCLTCDYRTGVAKCSAAKIFALCSGAHSLRAIKFSLAKLERIAWIKRWMTRGKHGNYPILIDKFAVRRPFCRVPDGVPESEPEPVPEESLAWWRVNVERTTDWRDIKFDLVTDGVPEPVPDDVPEDGRGLSPVQEVKKLNNSNKNSKAVKTGRAKARHPQKDFKNLKTEEPDSRFQVIKEHYEAEFKIKNPGVNPPFDASDARNLSSLLKSQPDQTADTLISWLQNAFNSESGYPLLPGFRLREFCSHATKFIAGPLKKGRTARVLSNLQPDAESIARIRKLVR